MIQSESVSLLPRVSHGPQPPTSATRPLNVAWHHLSVAEDDAVTDAEVVGDDELEDLPKTSRSAEAGLAIATTALGLIPVAGPAVQALANYVIAPAIGKRRERWLHELADVVQELQERLEGFDPRDLEGNEQFVSAVFAASDAAMRTHHDEKLAMLRNALVNGVLDGAPDEHEQLLFIRFVNELTPLHVRVLAFMADPGGWFDRHGIERPNLMMGGVSTILEVGMPELAGRQDLWGQLIRDLDQCALVEGGAIGATMTPQGIWAGRAKPLGQRFLSFITLDEPIA